jgi:outer membrane lipoprotein-sorting protein
MDRLSRYRAVFLLVAVLPLTGCLFHSHSVQRQPSTVALKTATPQELINYINTQAAKMQSMQATVDIDTSVGGEKRGKVTDYKEIRGYILAKKPAMLRMIGLMPIVRNRAFDMVSDGQQFKLWIPPKNKFVVGSNEISKPSGNALENLRPQVIYDALLLHPIDPEHEIAVAQSDYETVTDNKGHKIEQPDYEVLVIRKGDAGWYLSRKIIFSRVDLLPHQQLIYDEKGSLVTDAKYEDIKSYNGIDFPSVIEIWRPQEEYSITLKVLTLELNQPLTDEQFALQKPPGADLVNLDQGQHATRASDGNSKIP